MKTEHRHVVNTKRGDAISGFADVTFVSDNSFDTSWHAWSKIFTVLQVVRYHKNR